MDLTKRCCATCADDDCRTGRARSMNGIFLKEYYCTENNYRLWKSKVQVRNHQKETNNEN